MTPLVSVIAGSKNDEEFLEPAFSILRDFAIPFEFKVLSAHRNTDRLFAYIEEADEQGVQIYLTAAGFSAALPGVVAAKTLRPVLGIPVPVGPLQGIDALLSIVQLPERHPGRRRPAWRPRPKERRPARSAHPRPARRTGGMPRRGIQESAELRLRPQRRGDERPIQPRLSSESQSSPRRPPRTTARQCRRTPRRTTGGDWSRR